MDNSCSIISQYLNNSQCSAGGAEVVLFTSLISTLINAYLQLGNPNDYPQDASSHLLNEYDFIVIGAGSAGSVVASRLSEVENWKVLLIEAGGDPTPSVDIPGLFFTNQNTEMDWQYRTSPDNNTCLGLKNQQCNWPRGKVLGGSSSINSMLYTRANKLDYDIWKQMGNEAWGYDDVLPYFKKSEGNKDKEIIDDPSEWSYYHSDKGKLSVELFNKYPLEEYFLKAVKQLGYAILKDVNGPNQLGFAHLQGTLINATRCSAAKAFLSPVRYRNNLHVSKYSQVMKINIDPKSKQAVSVMFRTGEGRILNINIKKEVIVSGGTVNSPQILMLSGIGPKEHLQDIGIDVIKDLPVGKNLQDHALFLGSVFTVNKARDCRTQAEIYQDAMYDYLTKRKGPFSTVTTSFSGFIRSNYSKDGRADLQIIHLLINSKDINALQVFCNSIGFTEDTLTSLQEMFEHKDLLFVVPTLLLPKSRGEILLNSSDPFDKPQIHPRYFSEEIDIKTMLEGIRYTTKFMNTKAMRSVAMTREKLFVQGCENLKFDSDSYWRCMLKHIGTTCYHHVGTCKMGPSSDLTAVVDPQLKVHGVKGIRVVDESVMPNIVSANINAPTIMIGERASDFIKKDWSGPGS